MEEGTDHIRKGSNTTNLLQGKYHSLFKPKFHVSNFSLPKIQHIQFKNNSMGCSKVIWKRGVPSLIKKEHWRLNKIKPVSSFHRASVRSFHVNVHREQDSSVPQTYSTTEPFLQKAISFLQNTFGNCFSCSLFLFFSRKFTVTMKEGSLANQT